MDPTTIARLDGYLDRDRLAARTVALVDIPSHPGDETAVAEAYAAMLREAGLTVKIDRTFLGSPSVISRLVGGSGPTLQFAGHLDTIPVEQGPAEIRDGLIHGRGACDMKGGLAAFVEVAAILATAGVPLAGNLLVTAYGQHEGTRTGTMHEPLHDLLRRGIHGDAVIIGEGANVTIPLSGKGSIIFEVHLSRSGEPTHELLAAVGLPNPVMAAHRFVSLLEDRAKSWTLVDPDLGPETFFIGAIRGGDLYNRVPVMARIDGTRRYPAPRTYDEARAELEAVGRHVADEFGLDVEVVCHRSGQPFVVDPASRLVQTFQAAATEVMGAPLPVRASILATDMNHIVSTTGIPAVLHGPDIRRAHATPEWVPVDDVFRAARVFLRTALRFLS